MFSIAQQNGIVIYSLSFLRYTFQVKYKALTEAEDIDTLKKILPHVDLETGLKHRSE